MGFTYYNCHMGNGPWCDIGEANKFGYVASSCFLLTIHFYALAVGAIVVLGSSINGFSRLRSSKDSTISLQDVNDSKFAEVEAYLDKERAFEKSRFKIISISDCFRIEASKEVIIVNRDCKVTYPFSNAKIVSRRAQGDVLKNVHFILPVMCDGTQKSACNVVGETSFVFIVRESYSGRENPVEPGWQFLIDAAEIISATFIGGLLKLAELVNKELTQI